MAALLDPPAAAARLGITERHLRGLTQDRKIPFVRVGRLKRYDPQDLQRWIEENRTEAV